RHFKTGTSSVRDCEGRGVAVNEGNGRCVALRELDGEPQPEARSGDAQFVLTNFIEKPRAVAKDDGDSRGRIPDYVAKPAQAGKGQADPVPIRMQRCILGRSNCEKPLGRGSDCAGVGYV